MRVLKCCVYLQASINIGMANLLVPMLLVFSAGAWKAESLTGRWPCCWGTDWGDDGEYGISVPSFSYSCYSTGFFKILRGKNEVGIEAGVMAGMPLKY